MTDFHAFAAALATANGHPAPAEFADRVMAVLNAAAPDAAPAETPTEPKSE